MTKEEIKQLQIGDDLFVDKLTLIGYINRTRIPEEIKHDMFTELSECLAFNIRCVFLGVQNSTTIKVKIWEENIKTTITLNVHIECVS